MLVMSGQVVGVFASVGTLAEQSDIDKPNINLLPVEGGLVTYTA